MADIYVEVTLVSTYDVSFLSYDGLWLCGSYSGM
jgi:hypothetical protein